MVAIDNGSMTMKAELLRMAYAGGLVNHNSPEKWRKDEIASAVVDIEFRAANQTAPARSAEVGSWPVVRAALRTGRLLSLPLRSPHHAGPRALSGPGRAQSYGPRRPHVTPATGSEPTRRRVLPGTESRRELSKGSALEHQRSPSEAIKVPGVKYVPACSFGHQWFPTGVICYPRFSDNPV
ncbi:hypothetical protein CW362_41085 [Streptomyces populi]|uniref:Uncharacterized protein n=1 Tax=Streptomyces populi TaxID=2058924 RepID=A0A2I0SBQ0_9ACTN|nr:hypothetical protein CW362_41085 [Streptomyces populi]